MELLSIRMCEPVAKRLQYKANRPTASVRRKLLLLVHIMREARSPWKVSSIRKGKQLHAQASLQN